jgi:hypothetical protein
MGERRDGRFFTPDYGQNLPQKGEKQGGDIPLFLNIFVFLFYPHIFNHLT